MVTSFDYLGDWDVRGSVPTHRQFIRNAKVDVLVKQRVMRIFVENSGVRLGEKLPVLKGVALKFAGFIYERIHESEWSAPRNYPLDLFALARRFRAFHFNSHSRRVLLSGVGGLALQTKPPRSHGNEMEGHCP